MINWTKVFANAGFTAFAGLVGTQFIESDIATKLLTTFAISTVVFVGAFFMELKLEVAEDEKKTATTKMKGLLFVL